MMAHAIDHTTDVAPGSTDRTRSARAIGTRPGRCGATGPSDPAAGRRPQLRDDRDHDRLQFPDDRVVEASLRAGRPSRTVRPSSRLEADGADAGLGSADHDVDPPGAAAWRDPLVDAVARTKAGCAAHDCRAGLAAGRPATASARAVHAVDGSRV